MKVVVRGRVGVGLVACLAVGWLGLGAACSSSAGDAYPIYKPGDAAATTPVGSTTPGGNPDVNLGMPNGTVVITILSPKANVNQLGVGAPVDVDAKVTIAPGGTDVIDPQSVVATIALAGTTTPLATVPLVGPTGAAGDEFLGKLPLTGLKTGTYTIVVTAKTSANATGSNSVSVSVDAGPLITVISPLPGHHYKGSIVVLVAIDAGAAPPVQNVQAQIGAMPVALKETGTPGLYRAVFDLTMPTALSDEQLLLVSADDANHQTGQVKFTFVVDLAGPTITGTTPPPGTIVGGIIRLSAKISDDAGLNESTLQVLVGDNKTTQFRLPLTPDGAGGYGALFDTNNLTKCGLANPVCIVRPTLSFRAADNLGNESTVAYEIAVDNFPPIADLVPPKIRDSKFDELYRCSIEFDPLDRKNYYGDAPNDLCQVPQLFDLRARIEDDGNAASGIKQVPISTVDEDATAAYVLDTVSIAGVPQPLVVDTDGDGFCDNVNPKLQPTTEPLTGPKQVLKVRMKPVPPGGAADYWPPSYPNFPAPPPPLPGGCSPGRDTDPPPDLCVLGPQPKLAISYIKLPSIWSIEPIAPADANYCFGSQFDTRANNVVPPINAAAAAMGWKCIAVVTADKAGNRSTSAPIRVYLPDYDNAGSRAYCPAVPAIAGPPPSCTGTYDRVTGVVSPKACRTRSFKPDKPGIEICFHGDCSFPGDVVPL